MGDAVHAQEQPGSEHAFQQSCGRGDAPLAADDTLEVDPGVDDLGGLVPDRVAVRLAVVVVDKAVSRN